MTATRVIRRTAPLLLVTVTLASVAATAPATADRPVPEGCHVAGCGHPGTTTDGWDLERLLAERHQELGGAAGLARLLTPTTTPVGCTG